jgi:hypothetical protein
MRYQVRSSFNTDQEEVKSVEAVELENNMLKLPEKIAKQLRGKRIEVTEVKEGILLKTTANPIAEARGFLKGRRFTTQRYLAMKKMEKELE